MHPVRQHACLLQAQPFLSYGVLVVNLAVYLAGLGVRFSLGESSGESYFYGLAKVNDEVVQGEYYRSVSCASFACFCHSFLPQSCHAETCVLLCLVYEWRCTCCTCSLYAVKTATIYTAGSGSAQFILTDGFHVSMHSIVLVGRFTHSQSAQQQMHHCPCLHD